MNLQDSPAKYRGFCPSFLSTNLGRSRFCLRFQNLAIKLQVQQQIALNCLLVYHVSRSSRHPARFKWVLPPLALSRFLRKLGSCIEWPRFKQATDRKVSTSKRWSQDFITLLKLWALNVLLKSVLCWKEAAITDVRSSGFSYGQKRWTKNPSKRSSAQGSEQSFFQTLEPLWHPLTPIIDSPKSLERKLSKMSSSSSGPPGMRKQIPSKCSHFNRRGSSSPDQVVLVLFLSFWHVLRPLTWNAIYVGQLVLRQWVENVGTHQEVLSGFAVHESRRRKQLPSTVLCWGQDPKMRWQTDTV